MTVIAIYRILGKHQGYDGSFKKNTERVNVLFRYNFVSSKQKVLLYTSLSDIAGYRRFLVYS